jgi:hypothetical protein
MLDRVRASLLIVPTGKIVSGTPTAGTPSIAAMSVPSPPPTTTESMRDDAADVPWRSRIGRPNAVSAPLQSFDCTRKRFRAQSRMRIYPQKHALARFGR